LLLTRFETRKLLKTYCPAKAKDSVAEPLERACTATWKNSDNNPGVLSGKRTLT